MPGEYERGFTEGVEAACRWLEAAALAYPPDVFRAGSTEPSAIAGTALRVMADAWVRAMRMDLVAVAPPSLDHARRELRTVVDDADDGLLTLSENGPAGGDR